MLLYRKYQRTLLFSIFSFILGSMVTNFFLRIDPISPINNNHLSISQDLNQDFTHTFSSQKYVLIIIVLTSPDNIDRRSTIRETWFKFCKETAESKCYFVIGSKTLDDLQNSNLIAEQEEYNDLILLPNIIDSYTTLTQKLLESFVWIDKHIKNYDYVLKCDDDSFIRVKEVIAELKSSFENEKGLNLYWGFFSGKAQVKKRGKWQETDFNLCDRYLPYALGGGYVLSKKLVNFISRNSNDMRSFQSEDVSVGIWLAPLNLNRQHDIRFDTEYKSRGCSNQYIVTHKQSQEDMKNMFASISSTNKLCTKEYRLRMSYVYNWSVPPSQCCNRVEIDNTNVF